MEGTPEWEQPGYVPTRTQYRRPRVGCLTWLLRTLFGPLRALLHRCTAPAVSTLAARQSLLVRQSLVQASDEQPSLGEGNAGEAARSSMAAPDYRFTMQCAKHRPNHPAPTPS